MEIRQLEPGRILLGPVGSGKSTRLREIFRTQPSRFIVPTATMAAHLTHELAREGRVVRGRQVATLATVVGEFAYGLAPQILPGELEVLIRRTLAKFRGKRWQALLATPGFAATLSAIATEVDAAGYSSQDLAATGALLRRLHPDAEEFVRFYASLEAEVKQAGRALRGWRLTGATAALYRQGCPPEAWLCDGFYTLTEGEVALLDAARRYVPVTVTLPDGPTAQRAFRMLEQRGFTLEHCRFVPPPARTTLTTAHSFESEVTRIAAGILRARAAGHRYREMAVIVRAAGPYVPALRTAFERFRIPARFYFATSTLNTPGFQYADALAQAALSNWDQRDLLVCLRRRGADVGQRRDEIDFELRRRIPASGLPNLADLLLFTPLLSILERLDEVRDRALRPALWQQLFASLTPAIAALLASVTAILPDRPQGLATYWADVRAMAAGTPVREEDNRRDVVHVMDAQEARQWRLPVVFCAGLLEGTFPQHPSEDALFPDQVRRQLNEMGLALRTMADRQAEERYLLSVARSRAAEESYLSYPRFDRQGERTQPAFALEGLPVVDADSRAILPYVEHRYAAARATRLAAPRLQAALAARHATASPSSLESFLQCPFQFFGRYTLRLKPPPAEPGERLDALAQGTIIHEVLHRLAARGPQSFDELFDQVYERICEERNIPPGYLAEIERLKMLRDLHSFEREFRPATGGKPHLEQRLEFPLAGDLQIRARIDRYDVFPEGTVAAYDYKYSKAANVTKRQDSEQYVQGGLYLLGLQRTLGLAPRSFHYVALRDSAKISGWDDPASLREMMRRAEELTQEVIARIRDGEIAVRPVDRNNCQYCDFESACRIRTETQLVQVAT
ncbi:MAG: PD-(D/E)XK nuclease family protein [Bryobacteraceae bacterium]|nr:PD-(D/E)XK nuclease family protein [Bryobacteraceae bacterium]